MKARAYGLLLFCGWAFLFCLASCIGDTTPPATVTGEARTETESLPSGEPSRSEEETFLPEPDGQDPIEGDRDETAAEIGETTSAAQPESGGVPADPEVTESSHETDASPEATIPDVPPSPDDPDDNGDPDDTEAPEESTPSPETNLPDDPLGPYDPTQDEWDSQMYND